MKGWGTPTRTLPASHYSALKDAASSQVPPRPDALSPAAFSPVGSFPADAVSLASDLAKCCGVVARGGSAKAVPCFLTPRCLFSFVTKSGRPPPLVCGIPFFLAERDPARNLDTPSASAMGLLDEEEQRYLLEVEQVKQWWTDSRWRYTRRPFTAEQIVQKRGTLKIEYPSNVQAKKLWKIVEDRFSVSNVELSVGGELPD